ncbi:MAG TPA: penicillin-binding transpeptidase domain-containing protein [Solirubrobacteraceae bacterium]|jgi:penicillin-binding protein 2|nr:penicillin-binding transpeptidase domain-containing protein [Solirubrobacteraceae bacterium]
MIGPLDERTPPMTPQLALRVAVIGGFALVLFAVIFFRLWFLQVLSGSQYVAQAQGNIVRDIPVTAARGEIVDSSGTPLVESQLVPAIQISPESLPTPVSLARNDFLTQPAADYVLYEKLAKLLGMSTKPTSCKFEIYYANHKIVKYSDRLAPIPCLVAKGVSASQYANITIKSNVSPDIQDYIAERQVQFPGVLSQEVSIRKYPLGDAGAQVFGQLQQISSTELGTKHFNGIEQGNIVGQSGLEYEYNGVLQGVNGEERVKVNSANQFEGYGKEKKPQQGDTLKLSINARLEQAGQRALAESIAKNDGTGGAFVAIDPQNGQIYAQGSAPTYNPSSVSPTLSNKELRFLSNPNNNEPLINRAVDSPLPDGSTFKVITATAALESGNWSLSDTYDDDAKFCFTGGLCLQNSGGAHYGVLNLQQAFEVSDDEFFYNLGQKMNGNPADYPNPKDWPLQSWASKFGLGHTTGVDLPAEANGEIGSPKLQQALWKEEIECQNATGPYAYTNAAGLVSSKKLPGYHRSHKVPTVMGDEGEAVLSGGCAIASSKYWSEGDNVETGVGQYDDQVTPMQLAVVYAAIENGGTIVTPRIGQEIESPSGTLVQKIDAAPKRKLPVDPSYLAAIQQGLRLAASGSGGTSTDVMGDFPEPVYGKTGTAELGDSASSPEDAWYACYVPASATSKPIVVVVNVDKGGFGDVAAAPVARQILSQWFLGKPGPFVEGSSAGDQT